MACSHRFKICNNKTELCINDMVKNDGSLEDLFLPVLSIPFFFSPCVLWGTLTLVHIENGQSFAVWNLTFYQNDKISEIKIGKKSVWWFSCPWSLKSNYIYFSIKVLSNICTKNILSLNKTASGVVLDPLWKKPFHNKVENVKSN